MRYSKHRKRQQAIFSSCHPPHVVRTLAFVKRNIVEVLHACIAHVSACGWRARAAAP